MVRWLLIDAVLRFGLTEVEFGEDVSWVGLLFPGVPALWNATSEECAFGELLGAVHGWVGCASSLAIAPGASTKASSCEEVVG